MALWRHRCCLHVAVCEICRFRLLFHVNTNAYLRKKLQPYIAEAKCCLYVLYCSIVYIAIFRALAITKHLNGRNIPHNCAFSCRDPPPPNTLFPWPTRVFVPNSISIGSAVLLQLTIFSPFTLQWCGTCPRKLPLSLGGSAPSPNTWFRWPTGFFVPNGISIGSAIFLQLTIFSPYTLQWGGTCPLHCPFAWGYLGPHLIHWFVGPTGVHNSNDI